MDPIAPKAAEPRLVPVGSSATEPTLVIESAREVAGKSIGRFGLFYITLIVVIGVGSSYYLPEPSIAAVMAVIGGALMALIQMLQGITGTREMPEFLVIRDLIRRLGEHLDEKEPFNVVIDGDRVTITKGAETQQVTRGGTRREERDPNP